MPEITVSLPDNLGAFVEERVKAGEFASASQYIESLVKGAQAAAARQRLDAAIREGLNSGAPVRMTDGEWEKLRLEIQEQDSTTRPDRRNPNARPTRVTPAAS